VVPRSYFATTRDLTDSHFRRILDGLLNLIYPDACLICAQTVSRRRECGVCGKCWGNLLALKINPPQCPSCGLPLPNFNEDSEHLCLNCSQQLPAYSGARSFGYYSAELRNVIQALKFQGRENLVDLLAPLLARVFFDSWDRTDFDSIAAIPLHPQRRRERGFNQSELLARSLSNLVAIPYASVLHRVRPTQPQVDLTDRQRWENVRNAFRCKKPAEISGRRVLLIDDVMTTGATAASAAQTLLDSGVRHVSVLTVARATR
jgi:ComF family protein